MRVPIRAARLDSLFDEVGWVDLLKIDGEKHEPAVLAGMRKRLAQDGLTIQIEILNHGIGEAVARLVQWLRLPLLRHRRTCWIEQKILIAAKPAIICFADQSCGTA